MPVGLVRLAPPAFHLVLPLAGAQPGCVGVDFRCWPGRLHVEVWEMRDLAHRKPREGLRGWKGPAVHDENPSPPRETQGTRD